MPFYHGSGIFRTNVQSPGTLTRGSEMRYLKYALALLLTFALAVSLYFYWLLLTPVTAENVQSRLTNYCYLGTKALQINENSRLALEKLGRGSCRCLADKLVSEATPAAAAALTEGARRLGMFGLRRRMASEKSEGGGLLSKTGLSDKLVAEFAERYVKAANACTAGGA